MAQKRKSHDSTFKAKVAIEALKDEASLSVLAKRFQVHPTQISSWKRRLRDSAAIVFEREGAKPVEPVNVDELYEQIGRMQVELEFLKKKAAQFGG